jgi:hypothetical protein
MWDPLLEPTHIPELAAIHARMRLRHPSPSLELYAEYWNMLMGDSLHYAIERSFQKANGNIRPNTFVRRMRQWRIESVPVQGLENKIKRELHVLHMTYDSES